MSISSSVIAHDNRNCKRQNPRLDYFRPAYKRTVSKSVLINFFCEAVSKKERAYQRFARRRRLSAASPTSRSGARDFSVEQAFAREPCQPQLIIFNIKTKNGSKMGTNRGWRLFAPTRIAPAARKLESGSLQERRREKLAIAFLGYYS